MRKTIAGLSKKLLPYGTKRREAAKKVIKSFRVREVLARKEYQQWVKTVEPTLITAKTDHAYRPLLSIIIPVFNTPDKYLEPLLESITQQSYGNWELCVADGSTDKSRSAAIEKSIGKISHAKYKRLSDNLGIAGNTNEAINLASGEYIVFVDHDDLIAPFALNEIVAALNETRAEILYSDEDLITENGKRRHSPFFKPDWSPDTLRCLNYITHLTVVKTELVKKLNGIREGFEGAQDYDFILRATDETQKIIHITKILYHWRQAKNSTASSMQEKSYAFASGKKALDAWAKRNKVLAAFDIQNDRPGNHRVRYELREEPSVALVSGSGKIDYANYKQYNSLRELKESGDSFDFVAMISEGIKPKDASWLKELVSVANQPHVGAATGLILDHKGCVDEYGLYKTENGYENIYKGLVPSAATTGGYITWPRDVGMISDQVIIFRKEILTKKDFQLGSYLEDLKRNGKFLVAWPHAIFVRTGERNAK